MATEEQTHHIHSLNTGLGLDYGGYSFEADPCLDMADTYVLDCDQAIREMYLCPYNLLRNRDLVFLLVTYGEISNTHPAEMSDGVQDFERIEYGLSMRKDVACDCNIIIAEWTGAAGEPNEPDDYETIKAAVEAGAQYPQTVPFGKNMYLYNSGLEQDPPHPNCTRCGGTGEVECPDFSWSIYALKENISG
jgi:hypothetical protein